MSIYLSSYFLGYCVFVSFVFGSVMGSFLNCFAYRYAHHQSVTKGRSHCPACGHVLAPIDLIPILSWVMQKGKCRYCQEHISIRYPLTELLFALLTILCVLKFDITWECLRNYILLCCLFTLSLVDLEIFEIPNRCIYIPILVWIVFVPLLHENVVLSVLSATAYGGGMLLLSLFFDRILKKESMGGGDIKLLFVMGLYLGLVGGLFALFLACILGIFLSFFLNKDKENHFPFGPALSMAFWIVLLYGQPIIHWYMSFF